MQFPINIGLHRSFFQLAILRGIAIVASLLIISSPWSWEVRGSILFALAIITFVSERRLLNPIRNLLLSSEGALSVRFRGKEDGFFPVFILPGATVHPLLLAFRVEHEGHHSSLVITPDCMAQDDFRRLRLWLKWRATLGVKDGDV